VCYVDSTIALPLITAYALAKHPARPLKHLYNGRESLLESLHAEHLKAQTRHNT
jgi:deoxyhypusine synthase